MKLGYYKLIRKVGRKSVSRQKGFTVLELVVVGVAVIILAAVAILISAQMR